MFSSCAGQEAASTGSEYDVGLSKAQISCLEELLNYPENPEPDYNFDWTSQESIKVLGTEGIER